MTNALWFALAIALGTLAADVARAAAREIRWRIVTRFARHRDIWRIP